MPAENQDYMPKPDPRLRAVTCYRCGCVLQLMTIKTIRHGYVKCAECEKADQ